MCQYNDRCPVGRHRPGTKCPYTRNPRSRSAPTRPALSRSRIPSSPPVHPPRYAELKSPRIRTPRDQHHHQVKPRPRHDQNRPIFLDSAVDAATEAAVTFLFEPDGVYEVVADRLLTETKIHRAFKRPRGHWLCVVLNNAALSCETGTYIDLAAHNIEKGLCEAYGMPRIVAKVLTECAATGAKHLLAPTVFSPETFPTALRAIIALVCPNLARCPAQADVRATLLGPLAAKSLRAAVASTSSGLAPPSNPAV